MKTVLMIDREEQGRSLVSALKDAGLRVIVEADSVAGLTRAVAELPGAIILDEDMPALGNADLLPALRRSTGSLIIVKGSGEGIAETQALQNGADFYLHRDAGAQEFLGFFYRVGGLVRAGSRFLDGYNLPIRRNSRLQHLLHLGPIEGLPALNYLVVTILRNPGLDEGQPRPAVYSFQSKRRGRIMARDPTVIGPAPGLDDLGVGNQFEYDAAESPVVCGERASHLAADDGLGAGEPRVLIRIHQSFVHIMGTYVKSYGLFNRLR